MKNTSKTIVGALIVSLTLACGFEAEAQLSNVSALLSSNDINPSISSAEEFAKVESSIKGLTAEFCQSLSNHPNLRFFPTFDNNELVGFIITGVSDSKEADRISQILVELELLGETAKNADLKYFPDENKNSGRVSKRESRL